MLEAKLVRTHEEKLIAEFNQKNEILQSKFMMTNPFDFYFELFKSYEPDLIYISGDKKSYNKIEKTTKACDTESLLLNYGQFRNDVYIPPAVFFKGNYKTSTLKELYSFVVDLDGISPSNLKLFLKYNFQDLKLKPNFIVNSGSGLHLYYVLKEPFQVYRKYLSRLKTINSELQGKFNNSGNDYIVDKHSIIQPYRMVGSLTKLNQTVKAFIVEKKHYNITELAQFTNVSFKYDYEKKKTKSGVYQEMVKGNVTVFPNAKPKFYNYMGRRIYQETEFGTRYMSLFAMAVVAWKARIPKSQLEEDLIDLQSYWNEKRPAHPIYDSEIEKAMKGYNPKSTLVTSKQLEEWTGLEFNRPKRNGRTRIEHLEYARSIQKVKMTADKKLQIKRYLQYNPVATYRDIVEATEIGMATVTKYAKEVKKELGLIGDFDEKP